MRKIGFIISDKENEKRRAITLEDAKKVINKEYLCFQEGYGSLFGLNDSEFIKAGFNILPKDDVLNLDVLCDPKIGDADYINNLHKGQILFGWVHAAQNKKTTDNILRAKATAYAWEKMYYKGRHCFWRNNELAGESAILNAFQFYGAMPYNTKVAVLGRGNTAKGANRILTSLGADVHVYDRRKEKLFREEMINYDVIVNAILWDTSRKDHIIYKEDLKKLKRNCMIVDISCDKSGAIETSIPTTIKNPIYKLDGVLHYAVDHTPSIFHRTATNSISREIIKYIDQLIEDKPGVVLKNSIIIKDGNIIDKEIINYQNR